MPLVLLVLESLSRLPLCNAEETIGLGKRDIQRGKRRGHVSDVNPCLLFLSAFKRVMF